MKHNLTVLTVCCTNLYFFSVCHWLSLDNLPRSPGNKNHVLPRIILPGSKNSWTFWWIKSLWGVIIKLFLYCHFLSWLKTARPLCFWNLFKVPREKLWNPSNESLYFDMKAVTWQQQQRTFLFKPTCWNEKVLIRPKLIAVKYREQNSSMFGRSK